MIRTVSVESEMWLPFNFPIPANQSHGQEKDVPKILHSKVKSVYETYLRRHLPVLRR